MKTVRYIRAVILCVAVSVTTATEWMQAQTIGSILYRDREQIFERVKEQDLYRDRKELEFWRRKPRYNDHVTDSERAILTQRHERTFRFRAQALEEKESLYRYILPEETVMYVNLYLFSDFSHPVRDSVIDLRGFFSYWDSYAIGLYGRILPKSVVRKSLMADSNASLIEFIPDMVIQPYLLYYRSPDQLIDYEEWKWMGIRILPDTSDNRSLREEELHPSQRDVVKVRLSELCLLDSCLYTHFETDSAGKIHLSLRMPDLEQLSADYACYLNGLDSSRRISPEWRQTVVDAIDEPALIIPKPKAFLQAVRRYHGVAMETCLARVDPSALARVGRQDTLDRRIADVWPMLMKEDLVEKEATGLLLPDGFKARIAQLEEEEAGRIELPVISSVQDLMDNYYGWLYTGISFKDFQKADPSWLGQCVEETSGIIEYIPTRRGHNRNELGIRFRIKTTVFGDKKRRLSIRCWDSNRGKVIVNSYRWGKMNPRHMLYVIW